MTRRHYQVDPATIAQALALHQAHKGNITRAAAALGVERSTFRKYLKAAEPAHPSVTLPILPHDDIPVEDIIASMVERSKKRFENAEARDGQTIKVHSDQPTVLAFVGDPHLDDDGCDWPLLEQHIALLKEPNVYAINIGDTTNNWTGRLMRLYAHQETSRKTARRLAKWFMQDSGVRWLAWIMGNHDEWESGADILKLMNTRGIVMEDWQVRLNVEFDTGLSVPLWLAHDFKGRSQFNKLHGAMRTARERRGAAIYVCGHTHDWAVHHEEMPDNGETFWALRARGYKRLDSYAHRHGFPSSRYGATVAAVVNPKANDPLTAVTCFADLATAIAFKDSL